MTVRGWRAPFRVAIAAVGLMSCEGSSPIVPPLPDPNQPTFRLQFDGSSDLGVIPALDSTRLIIASGPPAPAIVAYDRSTGTERWRTLTVEGTLPRQPVILGNRVVYAGRTAAVGLGAEFGQTLWRTSFGPDWPF